jgi:hypothetical protein
VLAYWYKSANTDTAFRRRGDGCGGRRARYSSLVLNLLALLVPKYRN